MHDCSGYTYIKIHTMQRVHTVLCNIHRHRTVRGSSGHTCRHPFIIVRPDTNSHHDQSTKSTTLLFSHTNTEPFAGGGWKPRTPRCPEGEVERVEQRTSLTRHGPFGRSRGEWAIDCNAVGLKERHKSSIAHTSHITACGRHVCKI